MKKLFSIFLLLFAFTVNSQILISVVKTKVYDEYGSQLTSSTATVLICTENISSVSASGSGSILMLKYPQKLDGNTVTGYSVTSTPDQINTLVNSTAATFALSAGSVSAPSGAWSDEAASGWYRIGANNYGFSVNGTKTFEFAASGATLQGNTTMSKPIIRKSSATTYTATGTYTVTAAELSGGLLVAATSTAATTMVLPTTALMATQFGGVAGTSFDFFVDNSGASNGTVTVAVSTGMTASGFPSSNTLTLAGSATVGIAGFRVTFISATASTLTRIN